MLLVLTILLLVHLDLDTVQLLIRQNLLNASMLLPVRVKAIGLASILKQLLSVITNPKHRVMIGLDNITAIQIALEWKQGQLLLPEQVEALKR